MTLLLTNRTILRYMQSLHKRRMLTNCFHELLIDYTDCTCVNLRPLRSICFFWCVSFRAQFGIFRPYVQPTSVCPLWRLNVKRICGPGIPLILGDSMQLGGLNSSKPWSRHQVKSSQVK